VNTFRVPPNVTIRTKRLVLREFSLADATALFRYSRLPEAARFSGWQPYGSIDEVEALLERFIGWQFAAPRQHLVLAITLEGEVIGDIGLTTTRESPPEAELGYTIDPAYWRQGYGSEGAAAMVNYAFAKAGWQRVYATCDLDNTGSVRLLRKIGLKEKGILRQAAGGGGGRGSYLFALERPEWEAARHP
jgi:RimJ/RimL family protein N-acetyltransferase